MRLTLFLLFALLFTANIDNSLAQERKNILLLVALPSESNGEFEKIQEKTNKSGKFNLDIRYMSVGKVNATYSITKAIYEYKNQNKKIDLILNLGSAGGNNIQKPKIGNIITCNKFMQLDLDLTESDEVLGVNSPNPLKLKNDDKQIINNDGKAKINWLPNKQCGSTDTFSTTSNTKWANDKNGSQTFAIDMEAYALAKISAIEDIPFVSIKYITDITDSKKSNEDWLKAVSKNTMQKKLAKQIPKVLSVS
jgi:adenosylhomocysteine nucleosidase